MGQHNRMPLLLYNKFKSKVETVFNRFNHLLTRLVHRVILYFLFLYQLMEGFCMYALKLNREYFLVRLDTIYYKLLFIKNEWSYEMK